MEISDFIKTQCGDPDKNAFEPPVNFGGLVDLLKEFQKEDAWRFDAESMSKVLFDKTNQDAEKERLDSFINHEMEQRRFIAANSAMNGLCSACIAVDGTWSHDPKTAATAAVEYADALLAVLESSNKSNQQH